MFKKRENSGEELQEKEVDVMDILSKMIELEKEKHKVSPTKITVCIVGGIATIMFVALLCYRLIKTDFSFDSILSILLAFFSIFISIFFYFKADETSTNFYNSSYEFMKDISVTLGKIEERFGEKLNSLNDKVSHLDRISSEASEEIEDKKDDKDSILNDLMDKANLSEEERNKYKKELEEKDNEIEWLRRNKFRAEREARVLRRRISEVEDGKNNIRIPSKSTLEKLLVTHNTSPFSAAGMQNLRKLGIIDENGDISEETILDMLNSNY